MMDSMYQNKTVSVIDSIHYDADYFNYQKSVGEFSAWVNTRKFQESIGDSSRVVDFGCGGGFILRSISCGARVGIELNESAMSLARDFGTEVYPTTSEAIRSKGECWADVIISNHALEHTFNPLGELILLGKILKPGGIVHFLVPCETIQSEYKACDRDRHLYTWSPKNLGNLFFQAGFEIDYVGPYIHKWPPYYYALSKLGWPLFNILCKLFGRIERSWFQVEIRARRPVD